MVLGVKRLDFAKVLKAFSERTPEEMGVNFEKEEKACPWAKGESFDLCE